MTRCFPTIQLRFPATYNYLFKVTLYIPAENRAFFVFSQGLELSRMSMKPVCSTRLLGDQILPETTSLAYQEIATPHCLLVFAPLNGLLRTTSSMPQIKMV